MAESFKPLIGFFTALAVVGLALSVLSHLAALLGQQGPLANYSWVLHLGIFVVWIPAVMVSQKLTAEVPRKDFWQAVLRGSPPWMKYMVYGFFGYAVLNFGIFLAHAPLKGNSGPMSPDVVRGFSGHWMAFYAAALAILYSAAHAKDFGAPRRCLNGHAVGPLARFCERCGQSVADSPEKCPGSNRNGPTRYPQ
jgi:hypothetical protein